MNSSYFILGYIILVISYGAIRRVNSFSSFTSGVREGMTTVVNMFSFVLSFLLLIALIESCGILEYLEKTIFKNTLSPLLFVQMLIRPFSASSSYVMMLEIYNLTGVDSFISLFSTFIHTISDSTIYIVIFYFGSIGIKKYKHVINLGLIINLLGYILSFLVLYLLFK